MDDLPVVAYREFDDFLGWHTYPRASAPDGRHGDNEELTPHAPAQAALEQARAEVERLESVADDAIREVERLMKAVVKVETENERLTRELALAHQAVSNAAVLAALKSPTTGKEQT